MKPTVLIFFSLLLSLNAFSQPVTATFDQAMENGISFTELDSIYISAIHTDTTKAVFKENQADFIKHYREMMSELGSFLHDNNFSWESNKRFFQRIYFEKDGTIDYYFVHLARTDFSTEKKNRLKELLADFSNSYQLPIQGSQKFAQCSRISFADPQTKPESNK